MSNMVNLEKKKIKHEALDSIFLKWISKRKGRKIKIKFKIKVEKLKLNSNQNFHDRKVWEKNKNTMILYLNKILGLNNMEIELFSFAD